MAGDRSEQVDAYIARQQSFARPLLDHIRDAVHQTCTEVTEAIKWSTPHFDYKGKPLCNMAAFREHAAFGFWRGTEIVATGAETEAMGQFGKLRSVGDLPPEDELTALIRKAMALIDDGSKAPRSLKHAKAEIETPLELAEALAKGGAVRESWDAFPPSARRDYVEWIVGAKRPETRAKRVATTIEQLAEGKRLNWKYEGC